MISAGTADGLLQKQLESTTGIGLETVLERLGINEALQKGQWEQYECSFSRGFNWNGRGVEELIRFEHGTDLEGNPAIYIHIDRTDTPNSIEDKQFGFGVTYIYGLSTQQPQNCMQSIDQVDVYGTIDMSHRSAGPWILLAAEDQQSDGSYIGRQAGIPYFLTGEELAAQISNTEQPIFEITRGD